MLFGLQAQGGDRRGHAGVAARILVVLVVLVHRVGRGGGGRGVVGGRGQGGRDGGDAGHDGRAVHAASGLQARHRVEPHRRHAAIERKYIFTYL